MKLSSTFDLKKIPIKSPTARVRYIFEFAANSSLFGLTALTAMGVLAKSFWPFELTSHFRAQYFYGFAVLVPYFITGRRYKLALLSAAFSVFHGLAVLPLYIPQPKPVQAQSSTYRIMLMNVQGGKADPLSMRSYIQAVEPDIVLLIENNELLMTTLDLIPLGYTQSVEHMGANDYGIGLFSRLPFSETSVVNIGSADRSTVIARLILKDSELTVIGSHPPPPVSDASANQRDEQISALFSYAYDLGTPLILLGDFNATPWSPLLKEPAELAQLADSRLGFGIQATWPAGYPGLFRIPIDHLYTSQEVTVTNRETGPFLGSDHVPVVLDFSLSTERLTNIP